MRYIYGKIDWSDGNRGQENCFLLTNGLGGFSSQSMIGSNARNDQALLMACLHAPVDRYHMVTRIEEEVEWLTCDESGARCDERDARDDKSGAPGAESGTCRENSALGSTSADARGLRSISLSGQQYVDYTKNKDGQKQLQSFVWDDFPVWTYQTGGLQIRKTQVMKHGENTVGVQYRIANRGGRAARLVLTPLFQFEPKGVPMPEGKKFEVDIKETGKMMPEGRDSLSAGDKKEAAIGSGDSLSAGETGKKCCGTVSDGTLSLNFMTDGEVETFDTVYVQDLYYAHDSRDGRPAVGRAACSHRIVFRVDAGEEKVCDVIYSMEETAAFDTVEKLLCEERGRLKAIEERAGLLDETARQLVKAADQFIVERESTAGKSIIAGYPFFGDWGRDTMIALTGCCISTGRREDAQNIFRTFMKYCRKGIMPNMFPEGEKPPMYNTADASLLFVAAVYEYYLNTGDLDFVRECWETMKDILFWYEKGTDFHIGMDEDGLIAAGGGLEQVTWMDVRYQDILPTPRHGKPVEINAYWYNALCVMADFAEKLGEDGTHYRSLAEKVKKSFCEKFWNEKEGCLKDVLASEEPELPGWEQERRKRAENQIRCNQIWAVSQRFTMLSKKQERAVVDRVFEELYTPRGLRSLSPGDAEFQRRYMGTWEHRDLSYHQGTVWGFPLGGYFLAYLKVNGYSEAAKMRVREQLEGIEGALREGCIGQLAEVYDGENPTVSEGCFAQAWSTAELLRVYEALER